MSTVLEPFGIAPSHHIHPEVEWVEAETLRWASRLGLVGDARERERLRRSRVARAAARIAWLAPRQQVALFSQWVAWIIVVDDLQDEAGADVGGDAVQGAYQRLLDILEGQGAAAGAPPVERALEDLWSRTAGPMSRAWRERFIHHMRAQRDAFIAQQELRRSGRMLTLAEYPQLRRHTNSVFAFDLSEPVHGLEIPPALLAAWSDVCDPVNDVIAWCNDIVSVARDVAGGETTNHVFVYQHALGCDLATAVSHVRARIQERMGDLAAAEQVLGERARRLGLVSGQSPDVLMLAGVLRQVPGTHLGWLLETPRYGGAEAASASP